ncbi:unnamed protein product, partial [marine sediment metagenome]
MKHVMVIIALVFIAGCGEEFAAGTATGSVATLVALSNDAQERLIESIDLLNA